MWWSWGYPIAVGAGTVVLAQFIDGRVAVIIGLALMAARWFHLWAREDLERRVKTTTPRETRNAPAAMPQTIRDRALPEVAREQQANAAVVASLRRRLEAKTFCGNCGRERDDASPVFCRFCGFRLEAR